MNEDKQKAFNGYINYLYSDRGKSYEYIGRYIKIVKSFLDSDSPLNRTGYKKFMQTNAAAIAEEPLTNNALCEFLAFCGVGYSRKKTIRGDKHNR